ncbi:MAG: hypothetical protein JO037_10825 [Actinobacteria bacterium]|nr:hypothetical protein [Actinomycetota bacterium]
MTDDRLDNSLDGWRDLVRLAAVRTDEYVQLWEGAAAKLSDSSYRSEDLLDDWFKFWGKAMRDMTAGAALLWTAGMRDAPGRTATRDGRPRDSKR